MSIISINNSNKSLKNRFVKVFNSSMILKIKKNHSRKRRLESSILHLPYHILPKRDVQIPESDITLTCFVCKVYTTNDTA